jgi:enoyl-CoA hydratase/carnithine racemase
MNPAWRDRPDQEPVLVDIRGQVGVLTLNRPERLNAWTPKLGTVYFDHLRSLAMNPQVRVILVTGQGRAFCAGADVSGLGHVSEEGGMPKSQRDPRGYWFPLSIGKPIVAAIQGACYGVGVQQALCCDIRFVSEDVKISVAYVRRGLIGELGITWLLPRVVGAGAALDLMLSGRTIDAAEARTIGFANRVVATEALFEAALEYCTAMAANCPPQTMRLIKQQIYTDLANAPDAAFDRSEELLDEAFASGDFKEAMQALQEKREPAYAPVSPEQWSIDGWR